MEYKGTIPDMSPVYESERFLNFCVFFRGVGSCLRAIKSNDTTNEIPNPMVITHVIIENNSRFITPFNWIY